MLSRCGLDSNIVGITSDELDYLENVINLSYSNCPSKGQIQKNSTIDNNKSDSCNDSEPNFKGQLSKYFPESIRSNFNEVDFSELEASQLLVFNNILYGIIIIVLHLFFNIWFRYKSIASLIF